MIINNFKKLIEENKSMLNELTLGLFEDSIRCFDAGIYRQAYLLAYQGFTQYIRNIVLDAKMPTGYDPNKWNGVQAKLKNEKEFDEQVFTCIQQKNCPTGTPPVVAILDMPDTLRDDFTFWRNRRNDCAHYKAYDINASHVLAFYSMLNQYMLKITVEGGMKSLLREFKDAFDPAKTSPKKSIQPLVDKILLMVHPSEMNDFFDGLKSVTRFLFDEKFYSILEGILSGTNKELKTYVIAYLRQSNDLVAFLSHYPEEVGQLVEEGEVRSLWYSNLRSCRARFSIVADLISVGLLADDEVEECLERCIDNAYSQNDGMGSISEAKTNLLIKYGLLDSLKSTKLNPEFTRNNARECGQNHYDFFRGIAYTLPINNCTVEMMLDIFNQTEYPTVWCSIYKEMLDNDEERGKQFQSIIEDNGLVVPPYLK